MKRRSLVIGQLLNQYRLEEVVGEGGMGVVYRALDMNLERTVAVKLISASSRDDPGFVERFRQEARIQAGLNHPNIATLFDFFVWNDMPVAVMEFIKGETLRHMVDRTGPIPAHIALPIFVQALRGVAAGHKSGIIHRDLKPSNLMITDDGIVKITDFGIAKVRSNTGHTQESTRVGSAKYMAPEQILGRPVDEKTDIYIMGGTLYELLTGRPPFEGVSQFEIDSAHVRDRPKAPTEFCPDIPPAAVDAVLRALAKEPSQRFATAEEFIQALPDLQGVPYVAPVIVDDDATIGQPQPSVPQVVRAQRPPTVSSDKAVESDGTLVQQNVLVEGARAAADAGRPETASADQRLLRRGAPTAAGAQRTRAASPNETVLQKDLTADARGKGPETTSPDETLLREIAPRGASAQHPGGAPPNATLLRPNAPNAARARRAGPAIVIGGLVAASIAGVVLYGVRQGYIGTGRSGPPAQAMPAERVGPTRETASTSGRGRSDTASPNTASANTGVAESPNTAVTASSDSAGAASPNATVTEASNAGATAQTNTAVTEVPNRAVTSAPKTDAGVGPNTAANTPPAVDPKPPEPVAPAHSPTLARSHDLSGMWTGTYVDRSGRALLELQNLQMQQVQDGAITGRFTYQAGDSAGEECTLEKSSYSTRSKRLRLITHCRNPDHPKYLNVPLEFIDVDPGAATIEGGRLAFHLADDIVVTLKRTKALAKRKAEGIGT
jgi:serine/threonine protein kinase